MGRKLTLPKRIASYLIEIIIIIIGITISFALNDWDKRRSEAKDYQAYLQNLQVDIKVDSLQMVNDYSSYYRKYKGVDFIMNYRNSMSPDTLEALGQALSSITNYIEFLPNNNTFLILSSTGGFKVFKNKDLVTELVQLYQYDYAFIEMMGKEANRDRQNNLEPYLLKNIYYEDKITYPKIRTNIPKLVNEREFRNICIDCREGAERSMNSYRRAMKRLRHVDSLINVELLQFED